jgi:preprotein translocase subunit SecE
MAVSFNPAKFVREVRLEMEKVTWPSRRETMVTTGLVLALCAMASIFFLATDQVIGLAVRAVFGVGS